MPFNVTAIARACQEANRLYCTRLGDTSQPAWDDAPKWQQDSAIKGVMLIAAKPETTPEESHASWSAQKIAEGWTYGPVKDVEKKTHPCLVPRYDELPIEQRAKDYLFGMIARHHLGMPAMTMPVEISALLNEVRISETAPIADPPTNREVTTHRIAAMLPDAYAELSVFAGGGDQFGVPHFYGLRNGLGKASSAGDLPGEVIIGMYFQSGDPRVKWNGGTSLAYLAAIADFLACCQQSKFGCRENELALQNVMLAIGHLKQRIERRIAEGTFQTHQASPTTEGAKS